MKAVSSGGIRGGFSYVGNGAKKVYSSFKSYAAERTSEIRATIHKEMISSGLSKNSGTLDSDSNHLTDTEISWPSKPHTNKTEGHRETIVDKTNELAESGEYKKIYVNKGIRNEVKDVTPNRRADITAVKRDDKIDLFEVPSKSDDPDKLVERMKEVNKQLGDINLVYIKK